MTITQHIDHEAALSAIKQQVSKNWWILLVQGVATIVLGILLLTNAPQTLIALAWVLGVYWLVGGALDILAAVTGKSGNRNWFWQLVGGLFSVIVGLLLIANPMFGGAIIPLTLTVIVGVGAIVAGAFDILGAIMMRNEIDGEFWMVIWGLILVIFGILIIANLAVSTIIYVYAVAIFMMVGGIAAVFGAFRLRSLGKP